MADELNFQIPKQGFDSYLYNIIPDDQAVLAGAFSVSMQQIRNIDKVDITQFAQVAYSMESLAGLPFTTGTDIPTDLQTASYAKTVTALGSGVYGTFTFSNFFGCMSGLPYPLKAIYDGIKQLETDKLKKIYQELYLAVKWEQASFNVSRELQAVETSPGSGLYDWQYRITGTSMSNAGGGYTRNGAPNPSGDYTFSDGSLASSGGVTLTAEPDRDVNNVPGNFGKMINLKIVGAPGAWVTYATNEPSDIPDDPGLQYRLQAPPTTYSAYPYTGATNQPYGTTGWPGMNSIIDNLAIDANDEILAIKNRTPTNFEAANILDINWNITGTALKQEQRARFNFSAPVPIPYDRWLNIYPTALYVFVDSIPDLAKLTEPHMAAQTLEHISNLKNIGGQSQVGLMRESRNEDRLEEIGISLDNTISDRLDVQLERMLLTNGTLAGAVEGVPSRAGVDYTIPANPALDVAISGSPCDLNVETEVVVPEPVAIFDPNAQALREIVNTTQGNISAIVNNTVLGPFNNGSGPVFLLDGKLPAGMPPPETFCGEPPPDELVYTPNLDNNNQIPVVIVNPLVPTGETPLLDNTGGVDDNLQPPIQIIPVNLDSAYTSSTLLPSTLNVQDAIDKVIECNCDCWIN